MNLGQPMEVGSCTSCHYGVDGGGMVTWQGRAVPPPPAHRERRLRLPGCATLPLSEHGGLTLASTATCDNCHHISDSPRACGFCHDAPAGDTISFAGRSFLHDPHLAMGFGCDACHQAPSMAVEEETCAGCHSLHHTPTRELSVLPRRGPPGHGDHGDGQLPAPTSCGDGSHLRDLSRGAGWWCEPGSLRRLPLLAPPTVCGLPDLPYRRPQGEPPGGYGPRHGVYGVPQRCRSGRADQVEPDRSAWCAIRIGRSTVVGWSAPSATRFRPFRVEGEGVRGRVRRGPLPTST